MTAEQFDALPEEEGRKWELLDGELIEVSSATPLHNVILARMIRKLESVTDAPGLGMIIPATDLAVQRDSRLRPDLSFFSADTWRAVDIDRVPIVETPDIATEIISPSESAMTIQRKVEAYLAWGVREIWLIYPETKTAIIHDSRGARPVGDYIPGWQVPVSALFDNL